MIEDVIAQTNRRVAELGVEDAGGVRSAGVPVVTFSPPMADADRAIKDFLHPRLYRHARIARIMGDAEAVVRDLFAHYLAQPRDMPAEWRHGLEAGDSAALALRIADFIAGMTDRYAMVDHARLFGSTPELR
jgi:dGTPase